SSWPRCPARARRSKARSSSRRSRTRPVRKIMLWGIALAAILAGAGGGYRLGAGRWPDWESFALLSTARHQQAPRAAETRHAERTILYWKHPDGEADFSPARKKTKDGRDYVPVYDDEEADFKES